MKIDGDFAIDEIRKLAWFLVEKQEVSISAAHIWAEQQSLRLPTIDELITLIDRSRCSPAIDTKIFPECKWEWYWSSTPCAIEGYWGVNFETGKVCWSRAGGRAFVRAVKDIKHEY